MSDKTSEMFQMALEAHAHHVQYEFDETRWFLEDACESPIEVLLGVALCFSCLPISFLEFNEKSEAGISRRMATPCLVRDGSAQAKDIISDHGIWIFPQRKIENYRADFLVTFLHRGTGTTGKIVVEADGHDFHEKTKDQAARDKKRDRDMSGKSYRVMRFTGREIHKDAFSCAQEVMDLIDTILREMNP